MIVDPLYRLAVKYSIPTAVAIALSLAAAYLRETQQVYGMPMFVSAFACIAACLGTASGIWGLLVSMPAVSYFVLEGEGFAVVNPTEATKLVVMMLSSALAIMVVGNLRKQMERRAVEGTKRMVEINQLQQELEDSTMLLRELTHRVGNDLSTLSAIAGLKATPDVPGAINMRRMRDRIHVFASLYRRLAINTARAELNTQEFVKGICCDLEKAHVGLRPVSISVRAANIQLTPRRAVLVGLMLNETVTNALKYAFPDDRAGVIDVTFDRVMDDPHMACVCVSDNGVGPAAAGAPLNNASTGVGTKIIESMAAQLRGTFRLEREGERTVAHMRFPVD